MLSSDSPTWPRRGGSAEFTTSWTNCSKGCARPTDLGWISADLSERGVRRLLVEGGGTTHTQFLADDLADELHLVVAPFFVGGGPATRFLGDGQFPWHPGRRAPLAEVRQLDDVVLLRYALSARFDKTQFG